MYHKVKSYIEEHHMINHGDVVLAGVSVLIFLPGSYIWMNPSTFKSEVLGETSFPSVV